MGEYKDILGVQIFETGLHKGDRYTEKDLDDIVASYSKTGFIPPLKLGHTKDDDPLKEAALGWTENVRRDGNKLLADFMHVPVELYDAIHNRHFDRISSEIYFHYKAPDGTVLPKALKAIALLGTSIPAVKSLEPLRKIVHDDSMAEKFEAYDMPMPEVMQSTDDEQYISKLPDAAFALIIENGVRLFPHHDIDVKDPDDSETVNMDLWHRSWHDVRHSNLDKDKLIKVISHLRGHAIELEIMCYDEKDFAEEGIRFVIGRVKGEDTTTVQTVLFDKSKWSVNQAKTWLKDHDMHSGKVDDPEGGEFIRFRQQNPEDFQKGSFRTISPGVKKQSATSMDAVYKQYNIVIKKEEHTMELEERLKELEDRLAKVVGYKEEEARELETKVDALTKELEAAKQQAETFANSDAGKKVFQLQRQLEDTQGQLEQTVQKFNTVEKKKIDLEEAQRKERIERKVKDLKFPALRPYVEVFYEEATRPENSLRIVKFSADGGASKEVTIERVVDGLINTLNRLAENKFFTEHSTIPEFKRDDIEISEDPGDEVHKRAVQYMAEHKDVVYGDAFRVVLEQDPKLKEQYAAS